MGMGYVRIPFGRWQPDEGVFENPGVLAARGLVPWSNNVYRPSAYFAFVPGLMPNTGGVCYGMHVHAYGTVWEAYYAADVASSLKLSRVTLDGGTPATPDTGIASLTDVTWAGSPATYALGYRFASFGKNVIVASDNATADVYMRDSTTNAVFTRMIAASSDDVPKARYVCAAGDRVALAYITHSTAAEQARFGSGDTTNPNLVIFSGVDDPTYVSTSRTVYTSYSATLVLNTTLNGAAETAVVVTTTIPAGTPASGTIWVTRDDGTLKEQPYTSWTGSTFTIAATSYVASPATAGKNVGIGLGGSNLYDPSTRAEHVQLLDDLGDITGLIMMDDRYLLVGKERGMYRIDCNAFPVEVTVLSREEGTRSPHSLVSAEGWVYYYATGGHFARINAGGEVQNLSRGQIGSVLLATDWIDLGTFSASDPIVADQGAQWTITPDVDAIAGTPGSYRYPVGAWDPHSRTVRWIYPTVKSTRWGETQVNVDNVAWSGTDVTAAQNKPTGAVRVGIHWVAGYPGLGMRWASSATERWNAAPRDLLYAFESVQGPPVQYSLTYPWSDQDYGYLLLDGPQIRTSFFTTGADGARASQVMAFRLVYNRTLVAEDNSVDLKVDIYVRAKARFGSTPVASTTQRFNFQTQPPTDADGWYPLEGPPGIAHQVTIILVADEFDTDFPASAALVLNELQALEIKLQETTQ